MSHETAADPRASALRRWRTEQGLTLEALGALLGLSKSRLSEIETGSGCSLDTALEIEALTKGAVRCVDLRAARDPEPAA